MQSGKLNNLIELQRQTETVAASGAVSSTWATYATGRAELRQAVSLGGVGRGGERQRQEEMLL